MQHVKCEKCSTGISRLQKDSHNGLCGECYLSSNKILSPRTGGLLSKMLKLIPKRRKNA